MQRAKAILADATLINALQLLVHQAGEAIMQVYQTADFGIESKTDDSPVTKADLDAHYCLIDGYPPNYIVPAPPCAGVSPPPWYSI